MRGFGPVSLRIYIHHMLYVPPSARARELPGVLRPDTVPAETGAGLVPCLTRTGHQPRGEDAPCGGRND